MGFQREDRWSPALPVHGDGHASADETGTGRFHQKHRQKKKDDRAKNVAQDKVNRSGRKSILPRLTPFEEGISEILYAAKGRTVSRGAIVYELYQKMGVSEPEGAEKTLDVFVFRMRQKGVPVVTVRAIGFRIEMDDERIRLNELDNALHWLKAHYPKVSEALLKRFALL